MSGSGGGGVWVFKNGVMQLQSEQPAAGRKALLYVPTGEKMASLELLERRLGAHGWERYYENRDIVQLHCRDGASTSSPSRETSPTSVLPTCTTSSSRTATTSRSWTSPPANH
uniref:Uncharacterized protein n=1 Tax=Avena sativa TaxID=4498 RepID=A0ACD5YLN1_AVESA